MLCKSRNYDFYTILIIWWFISNTTEGNYIAIHDITFSGLLANNQTTKGKMMNMAMRSATNHKSDDIQIKEGLRIMWEILTSFDISTTRSWSLLSSSFAWWLGKQSATSSFKVPPFSNWNDKYTQRLSAIFDFWCHGTKQWFPNNQNTKSKGKYTYIVCVLHKQSISFS